MSGTVGICGTFKGVSRVQAVDIRRKCVNLGIVHDCTSPRGRIGTLNSYCKNHGRTYLLCRGPYKVLVRRETLGKTATNRTSHLPVCVCLNANMKVCISMPLDYTLRYMSLYAIIHITMLY